MAAVQHEHDGFLFLRRAWLGLGGWKQQKESAQKLKKPRGKTSSQKIKEG